MYAQRMTMCDPILLPIFDVIIHNLGIITGQDIFNPSIFIYVDINYYCISFVSHVGSHKTSIIYTVRGKGKSPHRTGQESPKGEQNYSSTLSLTQALDGCGWSTPRPSSFTPRAKKPDTHSTGGWVFPRAGLDRYGKSRPTLGFDPRTVQPVASRYTD